MLTGLFLKNLSLKNFATFENQLIEFHESFNGIIGETGSGKSLILDAFQLLLGSRSDKKLVRKGAEFAVIEGVFAINGSGHQDFFDEIGFPTEDDNRVVIKRIIYSNGKSKSFLNHLNCPLTILVRFARNFVDLVGQFENQKLTQSDYQLSLLDQYSKNAYALSAYQNQFEKYKELGQQIVDLKEKLKDKGTREDYLNFQLQELNQLNPSVKDENRLINLKNQLLNSEELSTNLEELKNLLNGEDFNLSSLISAIHNSLDKCSSMFPSSLIESFQTASTQLEDFSYEVSRTELDLEIEENLDDILEQLSQYQKLKRKFNVTTEGLADIFNELTDELHLLKELDQKLLFLEKQQSDLEKTLFQLALELHKNREAFAKRLEQEMTSSLKELKMEGATFKIQLTQIETFNQHGITSVTFLSETNTGEGFFRIKDIASGGELSRILLSLRQIVAAEDTISIFFFDEIDTGIGGETAHKIAKALKKVSKKGQVLAITHLPQIAKEVDEIIYVDKKSYSLEGEIRTISFICQNNEVNRIKIIEQLAGLS